MDQTRVTGYVVAYNFKPRDKRTRKTWKVRVQDKRSELNGKKMNVASIQKGTNLEVGVNVTFTTRYFPRKDGGEEKVLCATEVNMECPQPDETFNW